MNIKYNYGPVEIEADFDWKDVTHEIEEENAPFTLARDNGVGALQFSTAAYRGGSLPEISTMTLRKLLADFAESRELGRGSETYEQEAPVRICGQSFSFGANFVRVWYCSNGRNLVLITYTCERGLESEELPDCERIVRAVRFKQIGNQ